MGDQDQSQPLEPKERRAREVPHENVEEQLEEPECPKCGGAGEFYYGAPHEETIPCDRCQ